MTREELKDTWKEYAIVSIDGKKRKSMKEIAVICLGKYRGGLLFDTGGSQGASAYIFKSDEDDNCYQKTDWDDDESWELIGRFEKL